MPHDKDCPWSDPETFINPALTGLECTCKPCTDGDDPECFGDYNKINSDERAENDCMHCPVMDECAKVPNPIEDAFRAGRNACEGDGKRMSTVNGAWYAYRRTLGRSGSGSRSGGRL